MAPLAESVTFPPAHIEGDTGVAVTVGVGLTFTVIVCEAVQLPDVPVTE